MDKFNFFVGADTIDIEKAKKGKDGYPKELIIKGIASTNDIDSDGEVLEPSGYVLDRFLKSGYLNLEHRSKDDFSYIVGEPIGAEVRDNKLHIKGKLYKSNPKARSIYDTINMLKAEGSQRKIGFSIEGKALQRDPTNPKRITKALLTNCAITQAAKNQNTWAEIVKGEQKQDYVTTEANGGQVYLLDITKPDGTRVTIDKNFNIKVDKSMSTSSGAPLMPESVGKKVKKLPSYFKKNIHIIAKGMEENKITEQGIKKIREKLKNFS